ncbi:TetR/AcrR family transcriptional regulator [Yoonia sp. SS1-5]|uniref:TetR/AcrR family transcriptional regulator n=1 Tax=Yoonia rhodophyticola TaxID=3137370 RepID=A0AAN0MJL8_9RHOB
MKNQNLTRAKRTRDPDSKRTAIYEAAARLFTDHGYENVSIAKIAREAGIAVGTVYRFHDTKLTLLRAMLEGVEDAFVTRMASDWACDGTYAERIERMCYGLFEVAEDNLDLLKLLNMTTDIVFTDGSLPGDRIQNQIRIMYTEAMNVGASHQGDPHMMAAIAHGMVEGAMVRWMRLGAPKDIDAAAQLALVFKDGFMTNAA